MGLVLLSGGDLDLNGMQSLVETVFQSVKSNDSAKDNLGKTLNPPWGTAELGTKIEVLAHASRTDYGCLVFPVPEEYKYMFVSKNKFQVMHLYAFVHIFSGLL